MTRSSRLAPHDADLVEADAAQLYENDKAHRKGLGFAIPWRKLPRGLQDRYRALACNPYSGGPRR